MSRRRCQRPRSSTIRLAEERSWVEDLEDLGCWSAESRTAGLGELRHCLGELATAGHVEALQDPPVDRRGDGENVVGKVAWRVTDERAECEVLVDDDERAWRPLLVVRRGAAEEVVVRHVLSERFGELIGQVAVGESAEDRSVGVVEARVTVAARPAHVRKELLALRHRSIVPCDAPEGDASCGLLHFCVITVVRRRHRVLRKRNELTCRPFSTRKPRRLPRSEENVGSTSLADRRRRPIVHVYGTALNPFGRSATEVRG